MNAISRTAAFAHAANEYPREACGLLIFEDGQEVYRPCRNVSADPDQFVLYPEDYARAEERGQILAVVHSHPDSGAHPSEADELASDASNLPWFIVSYPDGDWSRTLPNRRREPLIGRHYLSGTFDCYSLIRDWYLLERGICLPNFDRVERFWEQGMDPYSENFRSAGFDPIDPKDVEPGDVVLMQIHSPVINHAGIFLEGGILLHHMIRKLSSREGYNGYYRKHTRMVIRHRGIA